MSMLFTSLVVASSDFTLVVIQASATGLSEVLDVCSDSAALLCEGTAVGFCVLEGCCWFSGVFGRAGEFASECAKVLAAANTALARISVNRCELFMMGSSFVGETRLAFA